MASLYEQQIKAKFAAFFVLISIGFIIFVLILFYWSNIDRKLPKLQTSETTTALRGEIKSADGYTVAVSQRLYKVMVDTRNIDENKKDLFVKLYALYSGDNAAGVKKRLSEKQGTVTLSYEIDSKQAEYLQTLARKLYKLGVFKSYQDPQSGVVFLHGMSIVESGERRIYPYKDILMPVAGYVKKVEKNSITKVEGVKGLERSYEDRLSPLQDSYLVGSRDISNAIILNRHSKAKERIDGQSIQISIPLKFQKTIENKLDFYREKFAAKDVIAVVMKSDTGDILSIASSNRYDITTLKKDDYPSLNIGAVEYAYEPGSVMKPIIYAILLREKKIDQYELVKGYGGKYKLGKYTISDEHAFDWMSAEDVIVHSSNIGIAQLAQKLDGNSYLKGLEDFGFAQNSKLDLARENRGSLPTLQMLNSEVYKGTVGYGYGLKTNFMQLIKAFNIFNNQGLMVNPKIGSFVIDRFGTRHEIESEEGERVVSEDVALKVHKTLIKTVEKGTGKNAKVSGLTVGGKTGTAEIAVVGKQGYNSSFIGFANDSEGAKYTIGVLMIEPTAGYFGAQTAAPVFKEIVLSLVEEGYLKREAVEE